MWQQGNEQIEKLTQNYQNILTKLEIDYLTNFSDSKSNFYCLPKIDKFALISEAIAKQNNKYEEVLEPSDLKLQPIVAQSTRPLSDPLDKILKPSVLFVKSYVPDSTDFLEQFSSVNNENTN